MTTSSVKRVYNAVTKSLGYTVETQPSLFVDYRQEIIDRLDPRLNVENYPDELQGFTLVEGFVTLPVQTGINSNYSIGGPSVPLIALAGNATGKMYFFAFKIIFPEVEI